jgi:hypothetical protein
MNTFFSFLVVLPGAVCLAFTALFGGAPPAAACSVPVFRYALERWPAGNFTVQLFHRDSLPETNLVAALQQAADQSLANFTFTTVAVSGLTNRALPWLTVEFPAGDRMDRPAWCGAFAAETGRLLLDSPARRELVRRLARGDAVVWVLLDGDAATAKLLDTELRQLEKEISIPEIDPSDPRTMVNRDLKIAFSVLPVTRTDPAEKLFVTMLLNAARFPSNVTGPAVFPVFGRGRVLAGFSGSYLNPDYLAAASRYVCGACSCEVKEQNPGVDLLLAANWDEAIGQDVVKDPPLPPLVSLASSAAPAHLLATAPTLNHDIAPAGGLRRNLIIALGLVVAAIIAVTMMVRRNSSVGLASKKSTAANEREKTK